MPINKRGGRGYKTGPRARKNEQFNQKHAPLTRKQWAKEKAKIRNAKPKKIANIKTQERKTIAKDIKRKRFEAKKK